jgi:uncharacterized damage-inducible protein DinB
VSDDDVRVRSDERRRLLGELELERNQLLRNIETCRIRDIDRPFIGDWSLKDIVAHVVACESEWIESLADVRAGQRPRTDAVTAENEDEANAAQLVAKAGTPFWELLKELESGRAAVLEALGSFSDEEVTDEASDCARVVREVISHDRRHWHEIAAKLAGMAGVRAVSPDPNPAATTTSS